MKIDRLIGILSILLQQEKVTAPYLAEKFEVSRRTINRDIEDICKAGIPLVTTQGPNGGISIMEGYRQDRTDFVGDAVYSDRPPKPGQRFRHEQVPAAYGQAGYGKFVHSDLEQPYSD